MIANQLSSLFFLRVLVPFPVEEFRASARDLSFSLGFFTGPNPYKVRVSLLFPLLGNPEFTQKSATSKPLVDPDHGAVVVSDVSSNHRRFSTIYAVRHREGRSPDLHPVSGVREFESLVGNGIQQKEGYIFYTRDADRVTGTLRRVANYFNSPVPSLREMMKAQDALWQSFQETVNYVRQ